MTSRASVGLAAILLTISACGQTDTASPGSASPSYSASIAPHPDYPGLAECQDYAVTSVDTLRLLYLVADARATLAELEPQKQVLADAKGSCEKALAKLPPADPNSHTHAGTGTGRVAQCKEVGERSGQAIRRFMDAMQYSTHTQAETVQLARQGEAYLSQAASAWTKCFDDPTGGGSTVPSELQG